MGMVSMCVRDTSTLQTSLILPRKSFELDIDICA